MKINLGDEVFISQVELPLNLQHLALLPFKVVMITPNMLGDYYYNLSLEELIIEGDKAIKRYSGYYITAVKEAIIGKAEKSC